MLKIENASPNVRTDNTAETPAPQMGDNAEQMVFLPQQSQSQSRLAPPQYYYLASKSGAVPSWAVAGKSNPVRQQQQQ